MTTTTQTTIDHVPVTFTDRGEGPACLLLHGAGGPLPMKAFADLLASELPARVLVPTHPGFDATPRPESFTTGAQLASLYTSLLAHLDLRGVTVMGSSMGGWIAAEMACLDSDRVDTFVLVDGGGIDVPGHPIADVFSLTPREFAERAYHDPNRFAFDPTKLTPEAMQAMAANRATLAVYTGSTVTGDPTLAQRLGRVRTPTLVVWGASDRLLDLEYGRALANAIPGARFEVLPNTGHIPQVESPDLLLKAVRSVTAGSGAEV